MFFRVLSFRSSSECLAHHPTLDALWFSLVLFGSSLTFSQIPSHVYSDEYGYWGTVDHDYNVADLIKHVPLAPGWTKTSDKSTANAEVRSTLRKGANTSSASIIEIYDPRGDTAIMVTGRFYHAATPLSQLLPRTAEPADFGTTNLTGVPITVSSGSDVIVSNKTVDWSSIDWTATWDRIEIVGGMPVPFHVEEDHGFGDYVPHDLIDYKLR